MIFNFLQETLEYIQQNFIYLNPGYTVLNTAVFGIILGISILFIIKLFKYIKKDPADLILPIFPFIFFQVLGP